MGGLLGGLLMPLGGSGVAAVVYSGGGASAPVYFDGHFPPAGLSYWGGHFPEGTIDLGLAPAGSATFALLLEQAQVTYAWRTGLFKSYSGLERRSNIVDDPAQRYEGSANLIGNQTRAVRARLARYAALGRPFLLGLSYEQLTIRATAVGATVYVYTTTRSDWAVIGGRVIVRHKTHGDFEGVIASVTADSITLTSAPGTPGNLGGHIMPAMAVYLDPTQGFNRYPTVAEKWQIRARNAIAGFASPAQAAVLPLQGLTSSGILDGAYFEARTPGPDGNDITITITNDAATSAGEFTENTLLSTVHVKYYGVTGTTADVFAALINSSSSLVRLLGAWQGSDLLQATDDVLGATSLTGGADGTPVEVGRGATVAEFAGRPLWNRGIDVQGTAPDSMQSMAQPEDLGGLPFNAGSASVPDWGRSLVMSRPLGAEFQWLKRFLDTVKGRWRTFWLASWREDLIATASGAGTLTITAGENAGDFFAWWPASQEYLQIQQADGTLTYVRVSAAEQAGDEIELTILDEDDDPVTLSGSAIRMVSWLERVRLESDDVAIQFNGWSFTMATVARVIQQEDD